MKGLGGLDNNALIKLNKSRIKDISENIKRKIKKYTNNTSIFYSSNLRCSNISPLNACSNAFMSCAVFLALVPADLFPE